MYACNDSEYSLLRSLETHLNSDKAKGVVYSDKKLYYQSSRGLFEGIRRQFKSKGYISNENDMTLQEESDAYKLNFSERIPYFLHNKQHLIKDVKSLIEGTVESLHTRVILMRKNRRDQSSLPSYFRIQFYPSDIKNDHNFNPSRHDKDYLYFTPNLILEPPKKGIGPDMEYFDFTGEFECLVFRFSQDVKIDLLKEFQLIVDMINDRRTRERKNEERMKKNEAERRELEKERERIAHSQDP